MAMDYTTLFGQIGSIIAGMNEVNTYRGTTLDARVQALLANAVSLIPETVTGIFDAQDAAETSMDGWISYLSSLMLDTIGVELDADRPMVDTSLSARIEELARRMRRDAQTLNDAPCTAVTAPIGSPVGDPTFVVTRHEYTGHVSDYMIPDVYTILCTADRSQGGTAFAETFSLSGKPADQLPTDSSYPSGASISTSFTLIDPFTDGGLVTDGIWNTLNTGGTGFEEWTLGAGTVYNTNVFQVADDPRLAASGKSLRFRGDGANVLKVRQQLDPAAQTVYTVTLRIKKVNDPGTDWAVSIRLVDSAGNALAGPAAYVNSVSSAACSSLNSSWANVISGTFVTPAVLPSTGVFLEVLFHQSGSLTTAAANLAEAYVSFAAMHEATPLYPGGIAVNAYSGIVESVVGDGDTITIAYSVGSGATVIVGMNRLLSLASLVPRLPTVTGGVETITDSVIA